MPAPMDNPFNSKQCHTVPTIVQGHFDARNDPALATAVDDGGAPLRAAQSAALVALFAGKTARKSAWALLDQGAVSGTRFVTTVLVGRMCGADELGLYAIAFSVFAAIAAFQESLILTPYTVLGSCRPPDERRPIAGSILVHHGLLALLAMVVLAGCGAALSFAGSSQMGAVMLVLAVTAPFMLLREFARRFAFAHLHVLTALALDAALAVVQLGGLAVLAVTGALSAAAAFGVVGFACAAATLPWLVARRTAFSVQRQQILPQLARNWSFGKWICGSQQLRAVNGALVYWLLSALISTAATGLYAACVTVVTVANPLILSLANIMEPKTAHALAHGGTGELLRVVRKVTGVLGVFLAVYWVAILIAGEQIVAWLYNDPIYAGQGHTIVVLASAMVVRAVRIGWNLGLKAMGRPRWNFVAGLVELTVLVATAAPLAWSFGVIGGAYGVLCGSAAGTAVRYWAFSRVMHAQRG